MRGELMFVCLSLVYIYKLVRDSVCVCCVEMSKFHVPKYDSHFISNSKVYFLPLKKIQTFPKKENNTKLSKCIEFHVILLFMHSYQENEQPQKIDIIHAENCDCAIRTSITFYITCLWCDMFKRCCHSASGIFQVEIDEMKGK